MGKYEEINFKNNRVENKPEEDGLVVIGAGFPRTGTSSTRDAMSILLDGPCYHMVTNVLGGSKRDWEFWEQALNDVQRDEKNVTDQVNMANDGPYYL